MYVAHCARKVCGLKVADEIKYGEMSPGKLLFFALPCMVSGDGFSAKRRPACFTSVASCLISGSDAAWALASDGSEPFTKSAPIFPVISSNGTPQPTVTVLTPSAL